MVVVSLANRRFKEKNSGREFGAIIEVEYELKTYIGPSSLKIYLEELPNNMRKSINGFLVQKLWPVEVHGFEALGRKEYRYIRDWWSIVLAYRI